MEAVASNPKLIPVSEALKMLSVSREAFYRRIKSGDIPSYKFGRKVLLNIDEVLEAMRAKG
ncbi:MAG: excisionase family DNA-binding protein [Nitrospira sp.]|nr:excisionase family DNA-binding protein [Nitrospira sp.]